MLLGFGYSQTIVRLADIFRDIVPALFLFVRRLHVVVDVLEVDLTDIGAPFRRRPREEDFESFQAKVEHPLRLVLNSGNLANDLFVQALAALEDVVVRRIVKPVLVITK